MSRWTTFDEETSSALRSKLPDEAVVELSATSAMEHAVRPREIVVAVLPARELGQAGLAVFRWNKIPTIATPPVPVPAQIDETPSVAITPEEVPAPPPAEVKHPSRQIRATGFLGLTDEAFDDEVEAQEKKSWWKRFWEE